MNYFIIQKDNWKQIKENGELSVYSLKSLNSKYHDVICIEAFDIPFFTMQDCDLIDFLTCDEEQEYTGINYLGDEETNLQAFIEDLENDIDFAMDLYFRSREEKVTIKQ